VADTYMWLLSAAPAVPVDLAAVQAVKIDLPPLPATVLSGPAALPVPGLFLVQYQAFGQWQEPIAPFQCVGMYIVRGLDAPQLVGGSLQVTGPRTITPGELVMFTVSVITSAEVP
jgi:hypothetical protein